MERETKEVVLTHSQKKVVLRTYLTENENREFLKKISNSEVEIENGEITQKVKTNTEEILKYKDTVIETWVVEFDGSAEKINERLCELRREDYNEVIEAVKALSDGEQKKTN